MNRDRIVERALVMTKTAMLAIAVVALAATVVRAAAQEQCVSGRAKAKGKYQKCVQNWLSKCYGKGDCEPVDVALAKLSKCRVKYGGVWPKLRTLTGTTCDAPRWVDNGDGTVTDNLTGLTWEKKTDDGSVNDRDNLYTWTDGADFDFTDEDGTAFTTFLPSLNSGGGFAGANGWRLPTFAELQTILRPEPYPCSSSPCIDPIFGLTASTFYWSSTTSAVSPDAAWLVDFFDGGVDDDGKDGSIVILVRAVRGDL